jgi:hypothetical protein
MPPRWLTRVVATIRTLAAQRKVRFTLKAFRELVALDLGLDEEDARHILANLSAGDFAERLVSRQTGEWMYVFKPTIAETILYIKVVVRADCIVVSFHEEGQSDEDNG